MKPLVIKDARIVNEGRTVDGDVLVRDGRIEQVGSDVVTPEGAEVIEAGGKLLLPGSSTIRCISASRG